jgi:cation transport ATPase
MLCTTLRCSLYQQVAGTNILVWYSHTQKHTQHNTHTHNTTHTTHARTHTQHKTHTQRTRTQNTQHNTHTHTTHTKHTTHTTHAHTTQNTHTHNARAHKTHNTHTHNTDTPRRQQQSCAVKSPLLAVSVCIVPVILEYLEFSAIAPKISFFFPVGWCV